MFLFACASARTPVLRSVIAFQRGHNYEPVALEKPFERTTFVASSRADNLRGNGIPSGSEAASAIDCATRPILTASQMSRRPNRCRCSGRVPVVSLRAVPRVSGRLLTTRCGHCWWVVPIAHPSEDRVEPPGFARDVKTERSHDNRTTQACSRPLSRTSAVDDFFWPINGTCSRQS
jgi:hypothetical protein